MQIFFLALLKIYWTAVSTVHDEQGDSELCWSVFSNNIYHSCPQKNTRKKNNNSTLVVELTGLQNKTKNN